MKQVGVISKYRESFIKWQKDTFDNIKILYFGKYIFEAVNDTRYISIINGCDLRGFTFDNIIELDCAKENPQYEQILTLAKPSLRPKFQATDIIYDLEDIYNSISKLFYKIIDEDDLVHFNSHFSLSHYLKSKSFTVDNIEQNYVLSEIECSMRKLSEIYDILKNKKDELFR